MRDIHRILQIGGLALAASALTLTLTAGEEVSLSRSTAIPLAFQNSYELEIAELGVCRA